MDLFSATFPKAWKLWKLCSRKKGAEKSAPKNTRNSDIKVFSFKKKRRKALSKAPLAVWNLYGEQKAIFITTKGHF